MHVNNNYLFKLLTLAFLGFLCIAPSASASIGCCQVLDDTLGNPTPWHYETLTKEACVATNDPNKPNRGWVLSRDRAASYSFDEGKTASADKKSCEGVLASTTNDDSLSATPKVSDIKPPELSVSIPGLEKFSEVKCGNPEDGTACSIPWIGEYLDALYRYSLLIVGILAVVVLMIGGVIWLSSAGNRSSIARAQGFIKGGVLGVIFSFSSYMILYIVNPNLTILRPINVAYIPEEDIEVVDTYSDQVDAPTDNQKYPNVKTYDPKNEKPSNASGCDNCVITSLPTKNNKNINKDLNAKLLSIRTSLNWRVTEAYPPSSKHDSKCHYNGRCVDIAIVPPTSDCAQVNQFINDVQKAGLTILNEYTSCRGKKTTHGTGGHLHVR